MHWVRDHVRHPNFAEVKLAGDRGMSEEQLIDSGLGWCNEQSRVFVALCGVMEIPARLCFLFHANGRTGHTATEVFTGGNWSMHDVTFAVRVPLPGGALAGAREIRGAQRAAAHPHYEAPLIAYYRNQSPPPLDVSRGGDLFQDVGICNYLIDGVEAPERG
jgi:transglutaminase-like putative cysteine protease